MTEKTPDQLYDEEQKKLNTVGIGTEESHVYLQTWSPTFSTSFLQEDILKTCYVNDGSKFSCHDKEGTVKNAIQAREVKK